MNKLRYQISNWDQLQECKSNNSKHLHAKCVHITADDLDGIVISVEHDRYGTLFASTLATTADIFSFQDEGCLVHQLSIDDILGELNKFGFNVIYIPIKHLSGKQLDYLMTLRDLHFDKIRVVTFENGSTFKSEPTSQVVAFNIEENPEWIHNTYYISKKEFADALMNGSAMNISATCKDNSFDWSFLEDYVYSIDDILEENI